MDVGSVLVFWGVIALLVVVPGPDWAFAVASGLHGHGVAAAAGITLGYLAMTAVVAAGLGALIAASPTALTALTVAGGLYLLWLGANAVFRPAAAPAEDAEAARSARATVARGIGVSGLNPKGVLVFVALLPQFTSRAAAWPVTAQMAVLGSVFAATCAVVYLAVGAVAQRVRHARPGIARLLSRVSGVAMLVVGTVLLVERLLAVGPS